MALWANFPGFCALSNAAVSLFMPVTLPRRLTFQWNGLPK